MLGKFHLKMVYFLAFVLKSKETFQIFIGDNDIEAKTIRFARIVNHVNTLFSHTLMTLKQVIFCSGFCILS